MAYSYRRHLLTVTSGLFCLLLLTSPVHAERFKQRGVAIPDAPDMFVQGVTRLDRNESGAELSLPLDAGETWQLLNRVLAGLGIKPKQADAQRQDLLTGWILWVWDPELETGRSNPPLKVFSRTYERHRFELSVIPDTASTGARIHISDSMRQREVDITPDSGYSWLQWQDAPVQVEAAWSFLRRLQGDFESALSSRLVPHAAVAPRIVEPVRPSEPTRVAPAVTPTEPGVASAPAPVAPQPVLKQSSNRPGPGKAPAVEPRPAVADESTGAANTAGLPAPIPTLEPQSVQPTPADGIAVQPATTPLAVQGGLLVDGGLDATWQALLVAIDALGAKLQSSDQTQHMLTTQWVNAVYEKKNQQFALESKAKERWAFDLWGKGRQRHRFQLILIPVEGGARTMVYAYHTGYQVETDRTPDSSQTLLYWKDHKTDPDIAMAFLRRLRIVVGQ